MIWDYPIVISVNGKKRKFTVQTNNTALPKRNQNLYLVSVVETDDYFRLLDEFTFLYNPDTKQTEVSREHRFMPVEQIAMQMQVKVDSNIERWE